MSAMSRYTLLVFVAACEFGGGRGPGALGHLIDAPTPDAKVKRDAPPIDAPMMKKDAAIPDAPDATLHLLLTEVALSPDAGEFVEIYNPTGATVDLAHYYLSNYGDYWRYPVGGQAEPGSHWIVQFPTAATLADGGVVTIATSSAVMFNATYGIDPTYSIADGTMLPTALSAVGQPRLTDTGAFVALFNWDGSAGIVHDVDIMVVGMPSATNTLDCGGTCNKSGVTQVGMTYATDADTIAAQTATPTTGTSTKRILAETTHETQMGTGNGLTGHDETSEATNVTWDSTFTAPTPGVVPAL
jgi:hypothetical protein